MEIYLLRHGIAEDAPAGKPDRERALTAEGRRKVRSVLKRARAAGLAPSMILSSPYLRAMQTAEIAAGIPGFPSGVVETAALEPMAAPEDAWNEIRAHKDEAQVLCASHEPLCSRLAAYLLDSPSLQVDFKKGAVVRIDVERLGPRPRGVLKWMLSPKLS